MEMPMPFLLDNVSFGSSAILGQGQCIMENAVGAEPEIIYNQYDYRMSTILKTGKRGSFEIKRGVVPEGTPLWTYDHKQGTVSQAFCAFDYPLMILLESGDIWMSDSQPEVEEIMGAVAVAKGDVLIAGLGIGLLPTFLKDKEDVVRIDIVEMHQQVIDLVFDQIASPKMKIINDDIFHYLDTTSNKYDLIYIDIWKPITTPLREIHAARRQAEKCLKPNGVFWCWLQELYDRIQDKLPAEPTGPTSEPGPHEPCLVCGKVIRDDYAGLCGECADGLGLRLTA
jgi:hypothetical protein